MVDCQAAKHHWDCWWKLSPSCIPAFYGDCWPAGYVRKLGNPLQDHRFDPAIGAVLGRCHLRAPWHSRMETLGNRKPKSPTRTSTMSTTPSCCKLHCCTGFTGTCSEPKKLHGLQRISGQVPKRTWKGNNISFPILSRRSHTLDLPSKTRSTGSCIQYLLRIACWQVLISSQVSCSDPNDVLLYDLEVSWSGLLVTEVPTPKNQNMVGYLQ